MSDDNDTDESIDLESNKELVSAKCLRSRTLN